MGYFVSLAGMSLSCIWFKLSLPSTSSCIASWPYWLWQTQVSVWLDAQRGGLVPSVLLLPLSFMESQCWLPWATWWPSDSLCYASVLSGPQVALVVWCWAYRGQSLLLHPHYIYWHVALSIPIVFIRTRSIWPSLTHALVDAMSWPCWPWTQMPFSSCSPRLPSSALCWPLPMQERGSRNTHIFPTSRLYVPVLGLSIVHRIGQYTSPLVHILMGKVSVLFHPWWTLFNFSIKMQ